MFAAFCLSLLNFSCTNSTKPSAGETDPPALSADELVVRGEYLVTIMGCNDCHSPKRMGPNGPELIPELLLSGYPGDRPILDFDSTLTNNGFAVFYPDLTGSAGPWGMSFAANLTPDATGIGTWTEEQFKKALKEGKYKGLDGTRMLLPPMPVLNFRDIKDEDVKAIFAYLKSLKPVHNVVPAAIPPGNM
ncbi:cytochrome c [Draconibacterium halophilum]|uniref:Cytochrome c n=2 Tax=Draconibacterium halophilum TaxID=2706887 RepID=A0A6C0RJ76_9BACT|nr:cytochrome c [Draconibacterium halophilum]